MRRKAIDHLLECIDVMDATGSRDLKLWFADGTNYPGQDDIRGPAGPAGRRAAAVYARLGHDQRMLLEYKLFEPAFYTTDVPDWGTVARALHALGRAGQGRASTPATTRPAPTSSSSWRMLLRPGGSAAFDFNSRFYADDDLMVGAADPFQLFRIMHEVISAARCGPTPGVAFMLDQCHNIEPKIPGQYPLGHERAGGDGQGAAGRPRRAGRRAAGRGRAGRERGADGRLQHRRTALLAELRTSMGLDPDPMPPTAAPATQEKIVAERVGGTQAGWGS